MKDAKILWVDRSDCSAGLNRKLREELQAKQGIYLPGVIRCGNLDSLDQETRNLLAEFIEENFRRRSGRPPKFSKSEIRAMSSEYQSYLDKNRRNSRVLKAICKKYGDITPSHLKLLHQRLKKDDEEMDRLIDQFMVNQDKSPAKPSGE